MTREGGAGLSDSALVNQAKSYGALLTDLRRIAKADILIRDVWEPLIQLGTATVSGSSEAMVVTPWHPLRLFELAAKAHQTAQVIERIVASSSLMLRISKITSRTVSGLCGIPITQISV